jgi:hypothetical protein
MASGSERRCASALTHRTTQLYQHADLLLDLPSSIIAKPYVEDELGSGTVELLRRLKETIDPQNIMVRLFLPGSDPILMTCMPCCYTEPGQAHSGEN